MCRRSGRNGAIDERPSPANQRPVSRSLRMAIARSTVGSVGSRNTPSHVLESGTAPAERPTGTRDSRRQYSRNTTCGLEALSLVSRPWSSSTAWTLSTVGAACVGVRTRPAGGSALRLSAGRCCGGSGRGGWPRSTRLHRPTAARMATAPRARAVDHEDGRSAGSNRAAACSRTARTSETLLSATSSASGIGRPCRAASRDAYSCREPRWSATAADSVPASIAR